MTDDEVSRILSSVDSRLNSVEARLDSLDTRMTNAENRLTSLDKTAPGPNERDDRVEGIVLGLSYGLTRLTWAVNIWGAIITILVGITLATVRR